MREQDVANMESKTGEEAGSGSAWTRVGRLGGEETEEGGEDDVRALAAAAAAVPTGGAGVS